MVRWMWIGATLMAIGGFITVFDRRYRRVRARSAGMAQGSKASGAQA